MREAEMMDLFSGQSVTFNTEPGDEAAGL